MSDKPSFFAKLKRRNGRTASQSQKTYVRIFESALARGYDLELHYLWLAKVEQAIARVRRRVRMGGHHIPAAGIRRRKRSL